MIAGGWRWPLDLLADPAFDALLEARRGGPGWLCHVFTHGTDRMFSLTVCDHILIAHSFQGAAFGPAQRLHGATFAVEAEFRAERLDDLKLLIDIALARAELRLVLDALDYTNLDDNPGFAGINTTAEFIAQHIHGKLAEACHAGRMGPQGKALSAIKVLIRESPVAWAAFEGPIG